MKQGNPYSKYQDDIVAVVVESLRHPRISEDEASALDLGSRALAEVAAALARHGREDMAEESARSAEALDGLRQRAAVLVVEAEAEQLESEAEQEAER
jgi:hypothetical protein